MSKRRWWVRLEQINSNENQVETVKMPWYLPIRPVVRSCYGWVRGPYTKAEAQDEFNRIIEESPNDED